MLRILAKPRGHVLVRVHHALPDGGAKADVGERLEYDIGIVHRFHRQHRRGAGEQQFRRRDTRGRAEGIGPVRGLHRPDAFAQPLQERHVVGETAEERLAEVHVGLNESGEHVPAACVDHRVPMPLRFGPDRGDAAIHDSNRTLHDLEAVVHCEDGRVADQEGRTGCVCH
jgi:hypothetical protein